jgi:diacylglycerol kinase
VDWYVSQPSPWESQVLMMIAVIILIAAEILVAAINIVVDLYAGVD